MRTIINDQEEEKNDLKGIELLSVLRKKKDSLRERGQLVDALEREKTSHEGIENDYQLPRRGKKPVFRESRELVAALAGGKTGHKGIERACRCPCRRKNRSQGNRKSLSMPLNGKKTVTRELRAIINAREEEKTSLKGIEPFDTLEGKKRSQGYRSSDGKIGVIKKARLQRIE